MSPAAASPEPALAKSKKSKRVIVRPKAGARVGRHPVKVVVKGRDGLFDVKARLNGSKITEAFGRTRKGKRRARISRSHGLRRGRNVLRVKARRRIGQRRRKAKIAFFVRHERPLAGAGRDRRIAEGEKFRLRGRALPYPRKPRVRQDHRIRYRWRITKAPRQSEFRDAARAGSARLAGGPLSKQTARHPRFTPDVRGRYRFKLRVIDGKRSSTDEVRLNAVPPTPFIPIETMLRIPSPAIAVGDRLYPAGGDGSSKVVEDPWLQVLVLDRGSLGLVSNKTYGCPYPHNCSSGVAEDLKKLDDTKLVIAVSHPGYERPYGLPIALAPIGFPKRDLNPFDNAPSGTVSAIGVPGLPAGQADISIDLNGPPGIANMDGYLTPDVNLNYTWLPKERPLYDTRESSTVHTGQGNVMEINGKKYESESFGSGPLPGGFQVLVLDGLTLKLVDNKTYFTNSSNTGGSTKYVNEMRERLQQVTPGQVVFITSILTFAGYPMVGPDTAPAAWTQLGQEIAKLGGSRHTFFEASAKDAAPAATYTLVGWGGAGEANGEESTSVKDPLPGAGRLQGALVPDHTSQFRPAVASVGDAPNETLIQLALQPERPWPLDGNAEAQNAIKWIGSRPNLKKLGPDPRSAYWIQPFSKSDWLGIANRISNITYPGRSPGHGFSRKNFQLARRELVKETKWVGDARAYLSDISAPFSDGALQSWADMKTIYKDVNNALNPPDDRTQASVLDVVRGLYGLIGVAGGPPAEAVAEVFQVGIDILAQNQDGSDANEIDVRASELEGQLVDRLKNAQKATDRIGDIIVSDYTKLSTVAINGGCNPEDNPDCTVDWEFTTEDEGLAAASVYKGIETLFSEQLISIAFPAYRLKQSSKNHNARQWTCTDTGDFRFDFKPFANDATKQYLPDNGQSELTIGKPGTYQVYALGSSFGYREAYKMTVPQGKASPVLDRMFSPAKSSLDPKEGGLGIYRPDFMLHANPRDYPAFAGCGFPGG